MTNGNFSAIDNNTLPRWKVRGNPAMTANPKRKKLNAAKPIHRNGISMKGRFLKPSLILFLGFLISSVIFGAIVIKDFSGPLFGSEDVANYEYMGFYFAKNFHLDPLPKLDLQNDQTFYPYGINHVFQFWGMERDIFSAVLSSLFGIGPWFQIYYLLSVMITGAGAFVLLYRNYSYLQAAIVGFLVSFFNLFAINKYPPHLSMGTIHWAALGMITDFLMVKKFISRENISLRFILVKILLLFLSLGLDLGYIAGCSLMSFAVSIVFLSVVLFYRYFKRESKLFVSLNGIISELKCFSIKSSLWLSVLMVFIVITGCLYIPLALQIAIEAKRFVDIPSGSMNWVSPYRLFIPYFPGFNPGNEFGLNDFPETFGGGSPGWLLLILGSAGLWQSRKRISIFLPFIIMFLLCIFYKPVEFPTLKIFPWFAFARTGGRFAVLYPIILSIFSLGIVFDDLRKGKGRIILALLVVLASIELFTGYSHQYKRTDLPLDKDFFSYMDVVKNTPGEAVLDFPFCIAGGNGMAAELGPYYHINCNVFALSRFHEKKVMGQYLGRLHPDQYAPYLLAGWDKLFFPDHPSRFVARRQVRCFNVEEWKFFTDFYRLNDFCGINLYVDMLPPECVAEFYSRFGKPVAETVIPGPGRVQYIPKPAESRGLVNKEMGKKLVFRPLLDLSEANLLKYGSPGSVVIIGMSGIFMNPDGRLYRWGIGAKSNLYFTLSKPRPLRLIFVIGNPIDGQDIAVEINGARVETISDVKSLTGFGREIRFQGIEGENVIGFRFKDWNHHKTTFAPNVGLPLSVMFQRLEISGI
jgi:hypothetical protein